MCIRVARARCAVSYGSDKLFDIAGVVVTPFRAAEYYLISRHRDVAWKSKIIKGIIVRARMISCGRARICCMIKTQIFWLCMVATHTR